MSKLLAVNIGQDLSWGDSSIATKFPNIASLVSTILQNVLIFAGVIFIGMLIFGGYKIMMTAGGDQKQAAQARAVLTNGIIGLVIVFCAFLIVQAIEIITGVKILNPAY